MPPRRWLPSWETPASAPCAWSATWAPGPPSTWPPPWPGGATSPTSPRTTSSSPTISSAWSSTSKGHPDVYLAYGGLLLGLELQRPHPARRGRRGPGAGRPSPGPPPEPKRWGSPAGTCWPWCRWPTAGTGRGRCAGPPGRRRSRTTWRRTAGGPSCPAGPASPTAGAVTCHWADHPDQQHKILIGWGRIDNAPGASARTGLCFLPRLLRGRTGGVTSTGAPPPGALSTSATPTPVSPPPATCPPRGACASSWPASWASTPSASWPSRSGGTRSPASGCATPNSGSPPGPSRSGTSRRSPFGAIGRQRVRAARPDVIYALLNWQALPLIEAVLDAGLDIPLVFHFKEGPHFCQTYGLWPALQRALHRERGAGPALPGEPRSTFPGPPPGASTRRGCCSWTATSPWGPG